MIQNNSAICVFNDATLGQQFCSFDPMTHEGKVKLYNAINTPDKRLSDFVNNEIKMVDVVVCAVKLSSSFNKTARTPFGPVNEEDETLRDGFRVVIIDDEGTSYAATSDGIYNSIKTMRAIFGDLHFEPPITIKVNQISTKNGKTLTLGLV